MQRLGIHYHSIPDLDGVNQLAAERGYRNRDEIVVSPEKMGDVYEEKVKMFFHEHLHEDEEIRYVRDGQGYFDVRGQEDEWIRIRVEKVRVAACLCLSGLVVDIVHASSTPLTWSLRQAKADCPDRTT